MMKGIGEFARFSVVGAASTIVNYGVFLVLLSIFRLDYILSAAIGYLSGVVVGFTLNKRFTFGSQGKVSSEALRYLAVYIISLFLGLSLLKFLVGSADVSAPMANVLVIGVTTLTNFLGSKFFAFRKIGLPEVFGSRLFIAILVAKLVFSAFFGSGFIVNGTIPFVDYFVSSGFANPYQHFLDLAELKAFPYSTTMLIAISIPTFIFSFLPDAIISNGFVQLFLARIPLLLADLGIFYILLKLLKTKEREVLVYYWCSPIIFYISYFHGQLDAIPTFMLLLAVYLMLLEKYMRSALVLGIALSAKANIFVALPFIFLYIWRNRQGAQKIAQYFGAAILTYAALVLPFIFSEGYQKLVLGAQEQWWAFILQIPFGSTGIIIYVVPLALLVFFMRLAFFRKINQDALMMAFAGAFTILVTLIPPRPGWFFWAVPFLAYFFVKDENISKKNYWAINALFLLHFLIFNRESDLFQSFQAIAPALSVLPNPYTILASAGLNAAFISNIVFTLFIGLMLVNFYFVYKFGLIANLRYRKSNVRIGLSGDSGSGKSYAGKIVQDLVGENNLTVLEGDDLHKWERGSKNWEALTHLNPKANYLHREIGFIEGMEQSKKLSRREYDHGTGGFTEEKPVWHKKFILVSGLHSFYLANMRKLLDIKIFLDPAPSLRKKWKLARDVQERGYVKSKVLTSMSKREKDAKKFLFPQKKFADAAVSFMPTKSWKAGVGLEMAMTLTNAFDPNPLSEQLRSRGTMNVDVFYNDDLTTITLRFAGTANPEEIAQAAYTLVPDLEEVLENRSPVWRPGMEGALQLVILSLISDNLRARSGEGEN